MGKRALGSCRAKLGADTLTPVQRSAQRLIGHLGTWKCPVACRCTCPSTTTSLRPACSSCARNPASYPKHHPLRSGSPALGIDGAGKASPAEMPGTLQLSHLSLSEGTLSFGYPDPKPLAAVFIPQNWKPVVPFHASYLAPVIHCSSLSATSPQ